MNRLLDLDKFAAALPSFTFAGRTNVPTLTGALMSIIVLMLTFGFFLVKLQFMLIRKNPFISTNKETIDFDEIYDTGSNEFMMAFAMEHYVTKEPMTDSRYTRWIVKLWRQLDTGPEIEYDIMHPCTESEFAKFYPTDQ